MKKTPYLPNSFCSWQIVWKYQAFYVAPFRRKGIYYTGSQNRTRKKKKYIIEYNHCVKEDVKIQILKPFFEQLL